MKKSGIVFFIYFFFLLIFFKLHPSLASIFFCVETTKIDLSVSQWRYLQTNWQILHARMNFIIEEPYLENITVAAYVRTYAHTRTYSRDTPKVIYPMYYRGSYNAVHNSLMG